jgi:hypothetical protein
MSRRLGRGSNVAPVLEIAAVLTAVPAWPVPEENGSA